MPFIKLIEDNCKNRIKPALLRDVKTEALLVFSRTALERYFAQLKAAGVEPTLGSEEDTAYVYGTLRRLLADLQECVVNIDYVLNLAQLAPKRPDLHALWQYEQPLVEYYNAMARGIEEYYANEPAYLPDFLIVCALSHWILEEEKSVDLYPFLKEIDFLELIARFELNRGEFVKEGVCLVSVIQERSHKVIDKLINKRYKLEKPKASKRKKRA